MKYLWHTFGGAIIIVTVVFSAALFLDVPFKKDYKLSTVDTSRPEAVILLERKININTATRNDLQALPGVGPAVAGKIVEFRGKNGKFNSIEELDEVKGIGEKTIERIRPFVDIR